MQKATRLLVSTFTFLLLTSTTPAVVLAHAGHGDEFHSDTETIANPENIEVDTVTAKQIGIKVQPVSRQFLEIGINTTGQIETQPNQQVEVTAPIPGTVAELLVKPGDKITKGQPVAVLSSPELIELRVESLDRRTEAEANLGEAEANLKLAQQNLERQRQIATAEITQASTQLAEAQERYDRDAELTTEGALPRRQMLESKTQLAAAKTALEMANSRREVLEAEAELQRTQTAVNAAKSRIKLSDTTYKTRLQQLSNRANEKGLVTVLAPITGTVAQRQVTLGESFEDAGGQLMTIVNSTQVWATANIYEKDLEKVKKGQKVRLKVSSLPEQTFTGQVTQIDPLVAGETRVVPVRTKLDNPSRQLKPGMFAQLEILTDKSPVATLVVPASAVVDTNGKRLIYVQNGQNNYQPVEVNLGETFENLVEVKNGLFEGDQVVVEGGVMLYAQSLRGGSKAPAKDEHQHDTNKETSLSQQGILQYNNLHWWLVVPVGSAIALSAFWLGRRSSKAISSSVEYLHFGDNKAEGRRQAR
ncbi:MAG: efflux RND transporter periplasmic adaptor subunit [Symploca sp. SIO3E6]|nr:efflux RND transporter periplasmic adaptor subunit [Caldora sp. SIO3E6]